MYLDCNTFEVFKKKFANQYNPTWLKLTQIMEKHANAYERVDRLHKTSVVCNFLKQFTTDLFVAQKHLKISKNNLLFLDNQVKQRFQSQKSQKNKPTKAYSQNKFKWNKKSFLMRKKVPTEGKAVVRQTTLILRCLCYYV